MARALKQSREPPTVLCATAMPPHGLKSYTQPSPPLAPLHSRFRAARSIAPAARQPNVSASDRRARLPSCASKSLSGGPATCVADKCVSCSGQRDASAKLSSNAGCRSSHFVAGGGSRNSRPQVRLSRSNAAVATLCANLPRRHEPASVQPFRPAAHPLPDCGCTVRYVRILQTDRKNSDMPSCFGP